MRKIGSYEEEQRRKERTVRNFSIFLLLILVISSVGYAFISNPSAGTDVQAGTETGVRHLGERWVFGSTGKEVSLSFSPQETKDIPVSTTMSLENYIGEPLFLDIPNTGVLTEIAGALQSYPSRIQEACYGNCARDLPEKDCSENMVIWKESNTSLVRQDNKCIFIQGDLRAADAYIYDLFHIARENL